MKLRSVLCWLTALVLAIALARNVSAAEKLDINSASAEEFAELPGIGPSIAQRIVDYRAEHGPFTSIEDLLEVKGIGAKTLDKFRNQIEVRAAKPKLQPTPSKSQRKPKEPPPSEDVPLPFNAADALGPPAKLSDSLSVFFTTPENTTDPSVDEVLASVLDKTRRSIDGAFFEINAEPIVLAFERAAQRGVRVRIVTDNDELEAEPHIIKRLEKAGIRIVADDREALMHDKFAILDGQQVWTGSYNATKNCTSKNDNNALWLQSKELADIYQVVFEKLWSGNFGPGQFSKPTDSVTLRDGTVVEAYFAPEEAVESKVMNVLRRAKKSVDVLAFSFTDEAMGEALISGSLRGLKVRVVIEKIASDARGGQLAPLQDAGIEAYADGNKYRLHHKVFLVDGETVITGSFNFSRSARGNNENLLILRKNSLLSRAYQKEFERVFALARSAAKP